MKLSRRVWIVVVALVCVVALVTPFAIRGANRTYLLYRFYSISTNPALRLAVVPIHKTFDAMGPIHPINLGYAGFDIGSTNPVFVETATNLNAVMITNNSISIGFLRPFNSVTTFVATNDYFEGRTPEEIRRWPRTLAFLQQLITNGMAAEMEVQETMPVAWPSVLTMDQDEFQLYFAKIKQKGRTFVPDAVWIFESSACKGIVTLNPRHDNHHAAHVFLASRDGKRLVGCYVRVTGPPYTDIAVALDPLLRSFHFTVDAIPDGNSLRTLIAKAGIRPRVEPPDDDAASLPATGTAK